MSESKWLRRAMGATLFALAFVVNPAFLSGCDPAFSFGEKEMVQVLDIVNGHERFTFTHEGSKYEVSLELEQKAGEDKVSDRHGRVVRSAYACGNRTFMRSAAACIDETTIPVRGKVTLKRVAAKGEKVLDAHPVEGLLMAFGTDLGKMHLKIQGDKSEIDLRSKDAKTFTLARVDLRARKGLHYRAD